MRATLTIDFDGSHVDAKVLSQIVAALGRSDVVTAVTPAGLTPGEVQVANCTVVPPAEPASEPVQEIAEEPKTSDWKPVTREDLAAKAVSLSQTMDGKQLVEIFERVAGVSKLIDVPDDKVAELFAELSSLPPS